MANPVYIERTFIGYSATQKEVHVIGPFNERKVATAYNKRTKDRCTPNTMHDFGVDIRITTRPVTAVESTTALYRMNPDEYTVMDIEAELVERG